MSRLLALAVVAGCGAPQLPPTAPPANHDDTPPTDGPIAPEVTAGLYWTPYITCSDCAQPAALVAYVTPDAAQARAIMKALDGTLPLGLPFAVHSDDLGTAVRGVVVVTGAFGTRDAAARALAATRPIAGQSAVVLDVPKSEIPSFVDGDAVHRVTVVDRGAPVPAWSRASYEAAEAAVGARPTHPHTSMGQHAELLAELRTQPPACVVQPGDLFVVDNNDVDWYELAPVTCNGQLAYIPWTSSLLGHAAIVPDGHGGHRLFQVIDATCDSPDIRDWPYDGNGRHDQPAEPKLVPDVGGGGGC